MSSSSTAIGRTNVADGESGSIRSQSREALHQNGTAPRQRRGAGIQDPRVLLSMPSLEDLCLYELPPPALLPDEEDVALESSESEDAEDYKFGGYHSMHLGETLKNGRYRALYKLGWGHFSTVWLCYDRETTTHVAIKVQKSAPHYAEAAHDEIRLLADLKNHDPHRRAAVVRLLDHFVHRGNNGNHVCLVFEVLGKNLLSLIKRCNFRGAPLPLVKLIAYQALQGLAYVHSTCGIIHTDVKPENILFVPPVEEMQRMRGEAQRASEMMHEQAQRAARAREHATEDSSGAPSRTTHRRHPSGASMPLPPEIRGLSSAPSDLPSSGAQQPNRQQPAVAADLWEDHPDDDADDEEEDGARTSLRIRRVSSPSHFENSSRDQEQQQQDQIQHQEHGARFAPTVRRRRSSQTELDHRPSSESSSAGVPGGGFDTRSLRTPSFVLNSHSVRGNPDLAFTSGLVKLVDFGNACWRDQHFTEDIQTRQYRSPEVILGAGYDCPTDIWSLACVVFEVATGDFLFDPHSGRDYDRDEDHLALMQELLGSIPRAFLDRCEYARDFFNERGELLHIRHMNFWTLSDVLREKYRLSASEADSFGSFLMSMLQFDPERRSTAEACLRHPWLRNVAELVDSMNAGETCREDSSPSDDVQNLARALTEAIRRDASARADDSAEDLHFRRDNSARAEGSAEDLHFHGEQLQ